MVCPGVRLCRPFIFVFRLELWDCSLFVIFIFSWGTISPLFVTLKHTQCISNGFECNTYSHHRNNILQWPDHESCFMKKLILSIDIYRNTPCLNFENYDQYNYQRIVGTFLWRGKYDIKCIKSVYFSYSKKIQCYSKVQIWKS